jgi:hypothetical protein
MIELTLPQRARLAEFGFPEEQIVRFTAGLEVPFDFVWEFAKGIALVQFAEGKLRCGILSISGPGGGVQTFIRFRRLAFELGRSLKLEVVELYGMGIVNEQLREMLIRQAFIKRKVLCPEELGSGEEVEILAKVFEIQ